MSDDYRAEPEEKNATVYHHHHWYGEFAFLVIVVGIVATFMTLTWYKTGNDRHLDATEKVVRCEVQSDTKHGFFSIYAVKPRTRYLLAGSIFGVDDTKAMMKKLDCPEVSQ